MTETSADITRREEQLRQTIETLVDRLKLRQWAIERAMEACQLPRVIGEGGAVFDPPHDVVGMARAIHAFVTEPANELLRD